MPLMRSMLAGTACYYLADEPHPGDEELSPEEVLAALLPRLDLDPRHPLYGRRAAPAVLCGSTDLVSDESGEVTPWPPEGGP